MTPTGVIPYLTHFGACQAPHTPPRTVPPARTASYRPRQGACRFSLPSSPLAPVYRTGCSLSAAALSEVDYASDAAFFAARYAAPDRCHPAELLTPESVTPTSFLLGDPRRVPAAYAQFPGASPEFPGPEGGKAVPVRRMHVFWTFAGLAALAPGRPMGRLLGSWDGLEFDSESPLRGF